MYQCSPQTFGSISMTSYRGTACTGATDVFTLDNDMTQCQNRSLGLIGTIVLKAYCIGNQAYVLQCNPSASCDRSCEILNVLPVNSCSNYSYVYNGSFTYTCSSSSYIGASLGLAMIVVLSLIF